MFDNLLSMRRNADRAPAQNLRTVNKLAAALAELPAPWRVLRNRRASAADGPPWVKYIVLHPEKGIALVDILPANPHAAIAPLDEFLARTGFAAFSHGDPPIVAVALGERDIAAIGDHLADAFAGASRCGIKNMNWTDAVVDLLMSTSGLFLTPIEKAPAAPKTEEKPPAAERKPPAAPEGARPAPRPPQKEVRPPEPPELPRVSPQPQELRPTPQPTSLRKEEQRAEPVPRGDFIAPESPSPSRERDAVFLAAPDPEFRVSRPVEWQRARRRRPLVAVLVGGSLAACAVGAFVYLRSATPPDTIAKTEPSAVQAGDSPAISPSPAPTGNERQTASLPPPIVPQPPAAAPSSTAATPPTASPVPLASATRQPAAKMTPPASVVATPPPTKRVVKTAPTLTPPEARSLPSDSEPMPALDRKLQEAYAKPAPNPRLKEDWIPDGGLTPPSNNVETVTINGTTYVKGREPQALGTVSTTEPPMEPEWVPSN